MGQTTLLVGRKLRSRSEGALRIRGADEPGSVAFKELSVPARQTDSQWFSHYSYSGAPSASDDIIRRMKAMVIQVRKALLTAPRFCRSTLCPSALGQSVGD